MENKFCGQRLNVWATFVGILYLISSIVGSTVFIVDVIKYRDNKANATAEGMSFDADKEIVSTLSVSLSLCLTFVLSTPLLLWGIYKKKYLFLVPWLYASIVCMIVNCMCLFVIILKSVYNTNKPNIEVEHSAIVPFMVTFGLTLQIICHAIVYKLYKELLNERILEYLETSSTVFIIYEEAPVSQS